MKRKRIKKVKDLRVSRCLYLSEKDIKKLQNGDSVVVSRGRKTNWSDIEVGQYIGIKEQGADYRKKPICIVKVIEVTKPLFFGDVAIKIEIFSMDNKNQPRQLSLI